MYELVTWITDILYGPVNTTILSQGFTVNIGHLEDILNTPDLLELEVKSDGPNELEYPCPTVSASGMVWLLQQ